MRKLSIIAGILILITAVVALFQAVLLESYIRLIIGAVTFAVGAMIIINERRN